MAWIEGDERRERLVPIKVTKLCAVCGADMKPAGGFTYATLPALYLNECSAEPNQHPNVKFNQIYPTIEHHCCEGGPQWGHAWDCPKCPG